MFTMLLVTLTLAQPASASASPVTMVELGSYAAIIGVVAGTIGSLKKLFPEWIRGKEPMLALVMTLGIGVAAKVAGLFPGNDVMSWIGHVVVLVCQTAAQVGLFHDKVVNTAAGKRENRRFVEILGGPPEPPPASKPPERF